MRYGKFALIEHYENFIKKQLESGRHSRLFDRLRRGP